MAARSSSSPRAFRLIGGGVRMPSLYCLARLRIRLFHPHAAGAKGGNQDMRRTKEDSTPKYIWPWLPFAVVAFLPPSDFSPH